jgi:hypothetical protein
MAFLILKYKALREDTSVGAATSTGDWDTDESLTYVWMTLSGLAQIIGVTLSKN